MRTEIAYNDDILKGIFEYFLAYFVWRNMNVKCFILFKFNAWNCCDENRIRLNQQKKKRNMRTVKRKCLMFLCWWFCFSCKECQFWTKIIFHIHTCVDSRKKLLFFAVLKSYRHWLSFIDDNGFIVHTSITM